MIATPLITAIFFGWLGYKIVPTAIKKPDWLEMRIHIGIMFGLYVGAILAIKVLPDHLPHTEHTYEYRRHEIRPLNEKTDAFKRIVYAMQPDTTSQEHIVNYQNTSTCSVYPDRIVETKDSVGYVGINKTESDYGFVGNLLVAHPDRQTTILYVPRETILRFQ